jgi:hypothetical protein
LEAGPSLGRYGTPSGGIAPLKNVDSIDPKRPLRPGRRWRIVAGPEFDPNQLHCATVSDGPGGRWEGGAWRSSEAKNRVALKEHFDRLDAVAVANDFCAVCGRLDDLVDRKLTICRACLDKRDAPIPAVMPLGARWEPCSPQRPIMDDLSIPDFLMRVQPR